ncbi:MAG: hypothetical protein BJ554DRAFT_2586, partial [Olpidium bornovanus]
MAVGPSSLLLLIGRRTCPARRSPALAAVEWSGRGAAASVTARHFLLSPVAAARSSRWYHQLHLRGQHASGHRLVCAGSSSRWPRCQKRFFKSGAGSNARRRRFATAHERRLAAGSSGLQSAEGMESKPSPVHNSPSSASVRYGMPPGAVSLLLSPCPGSSSHAGSSGGGGGYNSSNGTESLGGTAYRLKSEDPPPTATLDDLIKRHRPARFLGLDALPNISKSTISPDDNPFPKGLDDEGLGYFVHDTVKRELRALGKSLIVPATSPPPQAGVPFASSASASAHLAGKVAAAKAGARSIGDVIGDIPSASGRIVVIASPFKGGEINAEAVTLALASELNANFLAVSLADIFQRFSPTDVQRNKIEYRRQLKLSH